MKDQSITRRRFIGSLAAAQLAVSQGHSEVTGPVKWKLVVASDHAGFPMKGPVIKTLQSWGHTVTDVGTYNADPVDFPDVARKLCDEILSRGPNAALWSAALASVLRLRSIRFAACVRRCCHDTFSGHQCVEDDDVNVLCMGAWIIGPKLAAEVLNAYLNARFASENADLKRRVQKLQEMEKR